MNYVLYHKNCYDGFGAAFAAWLTFGEAAQYLPVQYGDPPPVMEAGSTVSIVDFSYPRAQIMDLARQHAQVVILDHHKTAKDDLAGIERDAELCGLTNLTVRFDLDESGATLAWDYFQRGRHRPELFDYIKDRDLWRFQLPQSREINAALRSVPFKFGHWMHLITDANQLGVLATKGGAILEQQDEMVAMMAKQAVWRQIGGYDVPVVNATVYFSEIGEYLCRQYPDAPFAAYFLVRNDHKVQWGLRSVGACDVSAVAKQYGGGGHPGAAGFVTTMGWYGEDTVSESC